MTIHLYAPCYNESKLLPYFFRHYDKFVNKYFIYDNKSTDNTLEILKSNHNVIVIKNESNDIDDSIYLEIKNNEYKKYSMNTDWVIVVDIDEFLYYPHIIEKLEFYKKESITLPKVQGYYMISEKFPITTNNIYEEVNLGNKDETYSKRVIFSPKDVSPNYLPGAHQCNPSGNIKENENSELKLLHFHFLSFDYWYRRKILTQERLSEINKRNNWGVVSFKTKNDYKKFFDDRLKSAIKII